VFSAEQFSSYRVLIPFFLDDHDHITYHIFFEIYNM